MKLKMKLPPTTRGMIICGFMDDDYVECGVLASWVDEAPHHSATANDWWCNKHLPDHCPDGWERTQMKQEIITLDNGKKIWYPYFQKDGKWIGWEMDKEDNKQPQESCGIVKNKKKWWQFWK